MFKVYDYGTGKALDGEPSEELVRESLKAEPTGAVNAYFKGVWHFIPSSQVKLFIAFQTIHSVVNVYVKET